MPGPYTSRVQRNPAAALARAAALAAALAAGCAAPVEPTLTFDRAEYDRMFDAALEAAREDGLDPVVVDRGLGIIETAPRTAGSLLEPWRTDNAGFGDAVAHTVNHERRRARFEFVPEGFAAPVPDPSSASRGAALPGSDAAEARFDLAHATGRIEVRAQVFVDRGFRPNQSFGRWTLGETRYSQDPTQAKAAADDSTRSPTEWTPVGRDVPYEQRLMRRITEVAAARPNAGPAGNLPAATDEVNVDGER